MASSVKNQWSKRRFSMIPCREKTERTKTSLKRKKKHWRRKKQKKRLRQFEAFLQHERGSRKRHFRMQTKSELSLQVGKRNKISKDFVYPSKSAEGFFAEHVEDDLEFYITQMTPLNEGEVHAFSSKDLQPISQEEEVSKISGEDMDDNDSDDWDGSCDQFFSIVLSFPQGKRIFWSIVTIYVIIAALVIERSFELLSCTSPYAASPTANNSQDRPDVQLFGDQSEDWQFIFENFADGSLPAYTGKTKISTTTTVNFWTRLYTDFFINKMYMKNIGKIRIALVNYDTTHWLKEVLAYVYGDYESNVALFKQIGASYAKSDRGYYSSNCLSDLVNLNFNSSYPHVTSVIFGVFLTQGFYEDIRKSHKQAFVKPGAPPFFDHCFGSDKWKFYHRFECFDQIGNAWICPTTGKSVYRFKDGSAVQFYKDTDISGAGAPVN